MNSYSNTDASTDLDLTSKTKQALIGLVDAVIAISLITFLFVNQTPHWLYQALSSINGSLLAFIALIVYRFLMLLFFNGTIGMKLFGAVLLNADQQPVGFLEKLLASTFILYRGVDYYDE